jgi:hypothetical protein
MKLAIAGIVALLAGAGLVTTAPFVYAQGDQSNAHTQELDAKLQDFKAKSDEVVKWSTDYLDFTVVDPETKVRKLDPNPVYKSGATPRDIKEYSFKNAVKARDEAAKTLAAAIEAAVQLHAKSGTLIAKLGQVYDELREINLVTEDAVLMHDETMALLDERALADKQAAAAAAARQ